MTRPNIYINPNAPRWLKEMLAELIPDANSMSREHMQAKLDAAAGQPGEDEVLEEAERDGYDTLA